MPRHISVETIPHGSETGYRQHLRLHDTTCKECLAAHVGHVKRYSKKKSDPRRKRQPVFCGTDQGYQGHKRRGEMADQACLDAHNAYCRAMKAERKIKAQNELQEGGVQNEPTQGTD